MSVAGLIFNYVKTKLKSEDHKRLLSNFISLSSLQVANYILPLITLPYLVRVLGPEKFGLISFAQAFIQYFNILTDYGFNLSATREISIHRENKNKIYEIFSSVMIIKFGLLILSLLIMSVIVFSFKKFSQEWFIYYLTFGMVIGQALFPVWFFQGMERMEYITFLNILAKLIFTSAIFIFVKLKKDYWKVPLFNSFGFILAGIVSLYFIWKNFDIRFSGQSWVKIKKYFKDSSQFFLSRVSVSIYTSSNTFILGLFTNTTMVGYYSMAEKIYIALKVLYNPMGDVLYPYLAFRKNIKLFKKIFKFVNIVNITILGICWFASEKIVKLMTGYPYPYVIILLKIFIIICFFTVPSVLFGFPLLGAIGYTNLVNKSVIYASLFHLGCLIILSILKFVNIYTVIISMFFAEFFVFIYRLICTFKFKIWQSYK